MENIESKNKRKKMSSSSSVVVVVDDEDEDEDNISEEEKIEKFFALIKNIREARERLMNGRCSAASNAENHDDELNMMRNKKKIKKVVEEEDRDDHEKPIASAPLWKKPSICHHQHEDLVVLNDHKEGQFKIPPAVTSGSGTASTSTTASQRRRVHEKENSKLECNLDLRLSL